MQCSLGLAPPISVPVFVQALAASLRVRQQWGALAPRVRTGREDDADHRGRLGEAYAHAAF